MHLPRVLFYAMGLFVLVLVLGYSLRFLSEPVADSEVVLSPTPTINRELSYDCQPGKTVFELLESNSQVTFDSTSFGKLVTSINGMPQGEGKYWLYNVDSKEATVGAESYVCQSSEKIKWELK